MIFIITENAIDIIKTVKSSTHCIINYLFATFYLIPVFLFLCFVNKEFIILEVIINAIRFVIIGNMSIKPSL